MGRDRANPSREFFHYEREENKSICIICNTIMAGDHAANLERHLKRHHVEYFEEVQRRKMEITRENDEKLHSYNEAPLVVDSISLAEIVGREKINSREFIKCEESDSRNLNVISNGVTVRGHVSILDRYSKRHNKDSISEIQKKRAKNIKNNDEDTDCANVNLKKNIILDACVELVTLNGCSFELMDCSGFRKILNPLLEAIGHSLTISAESIKATIPKMSAKIFTKISDMLKSRMISLKVDIVTKWNRSILGVNVQFVKDGKINIVTLGMKELKGKHTAIQIKNVVKKLLEKCGVNIKQIYSITTDNGMNMVKFSNLLGIEENGDILEENDYLEGVPFFDDVYSTSFNMLTANKCVAQILQTAIKDVIKHSALEQILYHCRELVKHLRIPALASKYNLPSDHKLKKLILDIPTRWYSTYSMLEALLECRDVCVFLAETNLNYYFSENQWDQITLILDTLRPLKDTVLRLQTEQLTLGDFYGLWLENKLKVENSSNWFSNILLEKLNAGEEKILENDHMLGAIYMDSRFQVVLNPDQKIRAMNHLKIVWMMIETLKLGNVENNPSSDEDVDALEQYLRKKEEDIKYNVTNDIDIEYSLSSFGAVKRTGRRSNILEFWEDNRFKFPYLYEIAIVVLASPATQISLERAFSSLKYILQDNRDNLSKSMLEDILFIRENFDLL